MLDAQALPQFNRLHKTVGDAYLQVQLEDQTSALVAMSAAQEALIVPVQRLTPMPNMPACVLGLFNRRSRVMWLVDLSELLGFQPLSPNRQSYNVAIIRVGHTPLGLAVQEVKGVSRFTPDLIQSPQGPVASSLTPYLRGFILEQSQVLLVLNAEAIVQSSELHRI